MNDKSPAPFSGTPWCAITALLPGGAVLGGQGQVWSS